MPVEFYTLDMSPYGRGVWMTLEALGIDYVERTTSPLKQENKTPEYAAISPLQKIPAIKDGTFALAESRAIAAYLCNKYGSADCQLYPSNIETRAKVDMILYMNCTWFDKVIDYLNFGEVFRKQGLPNLEKVNTIHDMLDVHEKFLSKTRYIASEHMTIADFFEYILVGFIELSDFDDYSKYPKFIEWKKKMSELPYHEKTCAEPLAKLRAIYQSNLKEMLASK